MSGDAVNALTRDELLVLLIEEAGEVIQAATKCLRFGFDRDHPGYGVNSLVLAREVGDFVGVMRALPLDRGVVERAAALKIARAVAIKRELATRDRDLARALDPGADDCVLGLAAAGEPCRGGEPSECPHPIEKGSHVRTR